MSRLRVFANPGATNGLTPARTASCSVRDEQSRALVNSMSAYQLMRIKPSPMGIAGS
jgi:hypothetical protein